LCTTWSFFAYTFLIRKSLFALGLDVLSEMSDAGFVQVGMGGLPHQEKSAKLPPSEADSPYFLEKFSTKF